MNGKQQAITEIYRFLKSDKKVLLITGTHQKEKHKLIMFILDDMFSNKAVLFRINGLTDIEKRINLEIESTKISDLESMYEFGNNYYNFDNLTDKESWKNSGNQYDFSILYPLDSIMRRKTTDKIITDLISRTTGKVFLVSWTDHYEYEGFQKIKKYVDEHIIYDSFEEDLEFHHSVIDTIEKMKKLN